MRLYFLTCTRFRITLAKRSMSALLSNWLSAVLPAWRDYGNYWISRDGRYSSISKSFGLRETKAPIFRSIFGQGAAVRASELRRGGEDLDVGELIWTDDIKITQRVDHAK